MKTVKTMAAAALALSLLITGCVSALAIATPTPLPQGARPQGPVTVGLVTQTWITRHMGNSEWQGFHDIKTEHPESLQIDTLLRLAVTYCMDAYPDLTADMMLDFEPRIESEVLRDGLDILCFKFISMTHQGDIVLFIDAVSGELQDSLVNEGGNG